MAALDKSTLKADLGSPLKRGSFGHSRQRILGHTRGVLAVIEIDQMRSKPMEHGKGEVEVIRRRIRALGASD